MNIINELAKEFNVSMKTMHNAVQILVKEKMLLTRRGSYGTIVISNSQNPTAEPRREMSIFAPAQETAFYHYEKIQNKIATTRLLFFILILSFFLFVFYYFINSFCKSIVFFINQFFNFWIV